MQTDYVQRFLFENLDIRGRLVCLTGAWQRMLEGRGYPEDIVSLLDAGRIEDGTRVFVETVAFGPGAWDILPQALKDTFINNALTSSGNEFLLL